MQGHVRLGMRRDALLCAFGGALAKAQFEGVGGRLFCRLVGRRLLHGRLLDKGRLARLQHEALGRWGSRPSHDARDDVHRESPAGTNVPEDDEHDLHVHRVRDPGPPRGRHSEQWHFDSDSALVEGLTRRAVRQQVLGAREGGTHDCRRRCGSEDSRPAYLLGKLRHVDGQDQVQRHLRVEKGDRAIPGSLTDPGGGARGGRAGEVAVRLGLGPGRSAPAGRQLRGGHRLPQHLRPRGRDDVVGGRCVHAHGARLGAAEANDGLPVGLEGPLLAARRPQALALGGHEFRAACLAQGHRAGGLGTQLRAPARHACGLGAEWRMAT
mmetsp:Transcript_10109/g.35332  ORF Transcript_10109/g.35332 Transcript_10109/m.35332 type:complete len:324 (+) Transcript_10109:1106-2077(+)